MHPSLDLSSIERVLVYPAFNARYYSVYLHGLFQLFGSRRIRFTTKGFPSFGNDCLAIRLKRRGHDRDDRIYIHSNDYPNLDEQGLAWCDVFGKVNLDWDLVSDADRGKMLPLGPTYAVRVWGPGVAEFRGVANFLQAPSACGDFRKHLANYRGQYASRFPEPTYRPTVPRAGYIFFNAAIWEREPEANALRCRFVEACRSLEGVEFEGGLTPRKSARGDPDFRAPGFGHFFSRRFTPREYLAKTRLSLVAMNNPAYMDCHSWRLAEYLALGKAIVSTPIIRELPAPLQDGIHIHYVDGSLNSYRAALERITGDEGYRKQLEHHARAYYEAHLAPTSVVRRVLSRLEGADDGKSPVRPARSCSPLRARRA